MTFNGELRKYQQEAVDLVLRRERCLLALDLGTGKTVVSIAAIEELRKRGEVKCAVLIMSSSLTRQWEERIAQFTDSSVIVIDGSISLKKRSTILDEAIRNPPAYLVIGIRQAVSDLKSIQSLKPELVLVDEVTSIKNFSTQQTKAIKKLKPRYRVGLTAEPIENGKAEELFSIMQWIDPDVFGDWQSFERSYINRNNYGIVTGYKNMRELNARLMDACIVKRKDDPDVAEFMPVAEEYNCYIEMDEKSELVYRRIARDILHVLYDAGPRASQDLDAFYAGRGGNDSAHELGAIGSRLLGASLFLSSPALLRASGDAYNESEGAAGSKYAASLLEALRDLPEGFYGAKVEAATELAADYLSQDPRHKVIIFSRFKGILPILQKELSEYNSVLFTGDMNGKERGESIRRFTADPDCRLFLSSDAGGYGVDLYAASHLINYDLPLSSGVFKQRKARHVRASSTFRRVFIDNLILGGTIEEYQLTRLEFKDKVGKAALTGLSDRDGRVTNEAKSLTKFLEDYLDARP